MRDDAQFNRPRVVVSTSGKFHYIHAARMLHERGLLQQLFAGYPRNKLGWPQAPSDLVTTYPMWRVPYVAHDLVGQPLTGFHFLLEYLSSSCFDRFVAKRLPQADVVMAMSSAGVATGARAQQQGMKYVCDRPCSHIRTQYELIQREYEEHGVKRQAVDPRIIAREETEYGQADLIITPSTFARNTFLERGFAPERVACVPLGVNLRDFYPEGKPNDAEFRIAFAGQISYRKGIPHLLKAFDRLDVPDKQLHMVGSVRRDIRPLISQYEGRPDVHIRGKINVSELRKLFSSSHLLVLPSVEDGFGMVLAEAMACGCPVLATTNTGAFDLIDEGVEGFLVPIRDPDSLCDKMTLLANDRARQSQMSEKALARVQRLAGWQSYGDQLAEALTKLWKES
ncbi:MAG: glycosyltransferase family 4 protein [Fimbriimonadaceae bacterium]